MSKAKPGPAGADPKRIARSEPRPPLGLDELLEILQRRELLTAQQTKEIEARATTLRSRVLKDRVGSVRSQAASRYEVTPVELVAAMAFSHPNRQHGKLDEDALAEALAEESGIPYLKIDPLRVDNDLVVKTLSRPFARHHVVIPVAREGDTLCLTLTDPFDTTLRQTLEDLIQAPLTYVVTAKLDVLQVIDRVYGFRAKVSQAETELGGSGSSALV